jgi:hypothetical protein
MSSMTRLFQAESGSKKRFTDRPGPHHVDRDRDMDPVRSRSRSIEVVATIGLDGSSDE